MHFNVLEFVAVLAIIVGSTVLHEIMHGVVAYLLGDTTAKDNGRLSINPLRHIDPYMSILVPVVLYLMGGPIFGGAKPVPVDSRRLRFGAWGMALVAIAGPATNFLLALVLFLIGHFTGMYERIDGGVYVSGTAGYIMMEAVMINLGFFVFNLIPIPPLDGSRVLYALAPDGVRRVMEGMERYGMMIVLVLVVILGATLSKIMVGAMSGILNFFYLLVGA